MPSTYSLNVGSNASDEPVGVLPLWHPGATHADMPQFYYLPRERRIEHVPRPPHFKPPQETFPGILYFTSPGWPGVLVKDILKDTASIEGSNDPVFESHGWRSTVVNLEWPGFVPTTVANPMHARIDVRPNGRPMTRLEFAKQICLLMYDVHKRFSRNPLAPGWERWSMNPDAHGIRVTELVLLSVHYYRTTWVPEFYVLERGHGTR